jgi:hypothetical protein
VSVKAAPGIDWRSQFSALRPYLEGAPGVVHVHAGPGAPSSAFARVLRSRLEHETWPFQWITVQIDPSNANTHYVSDIVAQIGKTAELALQPIAPSQPLPVTVGSDIKARGNVVVSNVDVTLNQDDFDRSVREDARVETLCQALRALMGTRRLALIFLQTHSSDGASLTNLGRKLWDGRLSRLASVGLLVIDIFDPGAMADKSPAWPPEPNLVVGLPDRFDAEAQQAAKEDLVALALAEGWFPTEAEAVASAETMLATSQDVRSLYAGIALATIRLRARS